MFFKKAREASAVRVAEIERARLGAREVIAAMREKRSSSAPSCPPTPARELEDELAGDETPPASPRIALPKPR